MQSTWRVSVLAFATLALAACGTSATASAQPSSAPRPSSAASASAGPAASKAPTPTPTVAVRCDKTTKAFDAKTFDLTGPWNGDDGGIYYLRQVDKILWWNGMSERA